VSEAAIHFVDANIPMYAVGAEHPLKARCLAILEAIATNKLTAVTDVEVLQEILHRYSALGQRERAAEVVTLFLRVVPEALPVTRADIPRAIELLRRHAMLQARDALHAAIMQNHNVRRIISADRHFDDVPGLVRVDPATWTA
jgi:uncharacterized protein